jgi:hypothetical protein
MKKLIFICALAHMFNVSAQERYTPKNELRFNPIYSLNTNSVFPEVSYERSLSHRSALGISVGVLLGSDEKFSYVDDFIRQDFSVLPYYRHYFGKEVTSGFFLEGNSIVLSREPTVDEDKPWKFGLGLGIGCKFELKNSWNIDFVIGGGAIFQGQKDGSSADDAVVVVPFSDLPDFYPRLGLTIGKRF